MSELTATQRQKLMTDLNLVIADAEELMKLTAGEVGDKASALRMRMQDRMDKAKVDLANLQEAATAKAKDAGRAADNYVHDNPWTAVGVAAGLGVVLGMLIARR